MRFLLAVALLAMTLLSLDTTDLSGAEVQARFTPAQLNSALSQLMGRRIRVGYRRGGIPVAAQGGGAANATVGRIHLRPDWYRAIVAGPEVVSSGLALAMGILAHELGHHTEAGMNRGVVNTTGGIDYTPETRLAAERAADQWAYDNMARLYSALRYSRPKVFARQSTDALRKFRKNNSYDH